MKWSISTLLLILHTDLQLQLINVDQTRLGMLVSEMIVIDISAPGGCDMCIVSMILVAPSSVSTFYFQECHLVVSNIKTTQQYFGIQGETPNSVPSSVYSNFHTSQCLWQTVSYWSMNI